MSTASLLVHFGVDTYSRLPVLRSVGFRIAECDGLDELPEVLASDPDAVLLSQESQIEEPQIRMEQAIAVTRVHSLAPLVLFASEIAKTAPAVDLVIRPSATPEMWLHEIAALILRSHQMRAESRQIQRRSAAMVRNATATRQAAREAREQLDRERVRMRRLLEMHKRSSE